MFGISAIGSAPILCAEPGHDRHPLSTPDTGADL
jgi:hypothetical protein